MIKYSPRAAGALAYLKRTYNDVDIYVEDRSDRNMWLALLQKALPNGVKLRSVNQLGGRNAVLEACKLDQSPSDRKRIYIIDGDFDFLFGRKKPGLKNLYRLNAYCVENLLISEQSLLDVGLSSKPDLSEAEIVSRFAYSEWVEQVEKALTPLFAVYAAANSVSSHIRTVGLPVESLYRNTAEGPIICKMKAMRRAISIARQAVSSSGLSNFLHALKNIKALLPKLTFNKIISGKDYILPAFHKRMNRILDYNGKIGQLKVLLAKSWDLSGEPWLCRRLKALEK